MARPGQAPSAASGRPGRHARPGRASRAWLQGAGVLLVALLVTAVTIVLVRDLVLEAGKSPPPVTVAGPGTAAADLATTTTTATTRPPGAWAGSWTVRQGKQTFVGYRVTQRFVGVVGSSEGVGRTPQVRGRIVLTDTRIETAELRADLRELASGDRRRDQWVGQRTLDVGRYPVARFDLTAPVALGERPAPGAVLAVRAPGTLTVHGVGRAAVFQLEGRWVGDVLEVVGRADIRLSEWGVEAPDVANLVKVDDKARIEVRLRLGRG
jgi:polyisoprenoid-binding protein YceI